jgi:hypothetical protein
MVPVESTYVEEIYCSSLQESNFSRTSPWDTPATHQSLFCLDLGEDWGA